MTGSIERGGPIFDISGKWHRRHEPLQPDRPLSPRLLARAGTTVDGGQQVLVEHVLLALPSGELPLIDGRLRIHRREPPLPPAAVAVRRDLTGDIAADQPAAQAADKLDGVLQPQAALVGVVLFFV